MTMLATALGYAERGWPVFPLAPMQKFPPKDAHGRLDATTDEEQIRQWWSKTFSLHSEHRNGPVLHDFVFDDVYNIGIDTDGAGLVVIDIDVWKGEEKCEELFGYEAWEMLLMANGFPSDRTYEVHTPSGGSHLYWEANPALTVKTRSGVLAPGVDVRAGNGSIVAAGSKTEKGEYKVHRDIPPKPLPAWLRSALSKAGLVTTELEQRKLALAPRPSVNPANTPAYVAAAVAGEIEEIQSPNTGTGNESLFLASRNLLHLVEEGRVDGNELGQQLYDVAIEKGFSHKEAVTTIKSALKI